MPTTKRADQMKKLLLIVFISCIHIGILYAQGANCTSMDPICTDVGAGFPASTNTISEAGNNYDCLGSQPNPAWYYFEIATNGNIDMELNGNGYDVDFIIWGPYSNLGAAQAQCGGLGNGGASGSVIDCSFSATTIENPSIAGAVVGQVYVMLITNYSNQVTNVNLNQIGGSGSTDCNIVFPPCTITNFTANVGACNSATNTFGVTGQVQFTDSPGGTLIVEDCNGNQQTFNNPVSPVNYNITGITADGAACDMTVYFVDDPACTQTINYTNPIACNCPADAGPDQVVCSGSGPVTIGGNPVTLAEGATYSWSNGAGSGTIDLTAPGIDNGQVSVSPLVTTTYTVTTNAAGCIGTDDVTITIDSPPTASNPPNMNAQCAAPAPDVNVVTTEADDFTNPPAVAFLNDVSNGASCPETVTRTYRVTDACGNYVDVTQSIIILDTQAPVFSAPPADVTVDCIGNIPAMTNLNWTDNCAGSGTVVGVDGALTGGACGGTITRTWTYTDPCGNASTVSQLITINDNAPPTASNPAPVSGSLPTPDINVVIDEADNCGVPVVTFLNDVSDGGSCPEIITRTYRVTDACGNFVDVIQTISVFDTELPTASNPVGVFIECIDDIPNVDITVVTDEADNNGIPVVTWEDDISNGNSCPEIIARRYRITDDCSNFIFVTQNITINDISDPVFVVDPPGPAIIECGMGVLSMIDLDWTDNCDGFGTVSGLDVALGGGKFQRNWVYTDECGNSVSKEQLITYISCLPEAPNIITVNGDNVNDLFVFKNLEYYPGSRLVVLNRWGNVVYENSDYQNTWDGGDVTDGVYFYKLELNVPLDGLLDLESGNTMEGFVQVVH